MNTMRGMKKDLMVVMSLLPGWDSAKPCGTPDSSHHRRSRESSHDAECLELSELTLSPAPRRVNEVMERLEEISSRVREEAVALEEQRAHSAAGVLGLDLVGGHAEEGGGGGGGGGGAESHDDNVSTTLSSAETSSDLFWDCGGSRDGDREAGRPLIVNHVVEQGDSVGGICVRYGVSLGQLLQANKAFSAQSLLARKALVIPNVAQMDM